MQIDCLVCFKIGYVPAGRGIMRQVLGRVSKIDSGCIGDFLGRPTGQESHLSPPDRCSLAKTTLNKSRILHVLEKSHQLWQSLPGMEGMELAGASRGAARGRGGGGGTGHV